MESQIKSRKLKRTLTFSNAGSTAIYVDLNDQEGKLGNQLCAYGLLVGNTIQLKNEDIENFEAFKKICDNWYKHHLQNQV